MVDGEKNSKLMPVESATTAKKNVHLLLQRRRLRKDEFTLYSFAWRRMSKGRQINRDEAIVTRNWSAEEREL